ncbi:unnamed protein product [Lactuca virosa]|uniref:Uncharacterized protein n=1 Tax=Lactuca virosa TaxID=75947 RepID=A0AAU9PB03_9ASTR|nr:unnamed protein product [Lactuca virosa]
MKIQLLKPYLATFIATPSLAPLLPSIMTRNPNSLHNLNRHHQRRGGDKENAKPSISDSSISFIPQSLSTFTWVLGILVVLMFIPIVEKSKRVFRIQKKKVKHLDYDRESNQFHGHLVYKVSHREMKSFGKEINNALMPKSLTRPDCEDRCYPPPSWLFYLETTPLTMISVGLELLTFVSISHIYQLLYLKFKATNYNFMRWIMLHGFMMKMHKRRVSLMIMTSKTTIVTIDGIGHIWTQVTY